METIEKRIITFIHQHHVLTLATCSENKPYCCSCFYVYIDELNLFVFTSEKTTRHIQDTENQKRVSGAIAIETSIVGKIRGLQFTGTIRELKGCDLKTAKSSYLQRFPIAVLSHLLLWGVEVDFFKLTDNRLGFGKKIIWEKQEKK